jgi:S-adenosyl methyltransferase
MRPYRELTSPGHTRRASTTTTSAARTIAVDRETGEQGERTRPTVRTGARENRKFLARAVRYLAAEAGIRQFLDIGTGLPSAGNTHEVAQRIAPDSRIVYVDNDRCKSGCAHARGAGCLSA